MPLIGLQKGPRIFLLAMETLIFEHTHLSSPITDFNLASFQMSSIMAAKPGSQGTASDDNERKGHFQQQPVNWICVFSHQSSTVCQGCSGVKDGQQLVVVKNCGSFLFFLKNQSCGFAFQSLLTVTFVLLEVLLSISEAYHQLFDLE